jgi:hypothetical protein
LPCGLAAARDLGAHEPRPRNGRRSCAENEKGRPTASGATGGEEKWKTHGGLSSGQDMCSVVCPNLPSGTHGRFRRNGISFYVHHEMAGHLPQFSSIGPFQCVNTSCQEHDRRWEKSKKHRRSWSRKGGGTPSITVFTLRPRHCRLPSASICSFGFPGVPLNPHL